MVHNTGVVKGTQMSTSNFSDIKTPADLERANAEVTDTPEADKILDLLMEQEPSVGLEVVVRTLSALRDFHTVGVEQYKEEGNIDAAVIWQKDATLLDRAISMIRDIAL